MQTIPAVINGELRAVPVLTAAHVATYHAICTGTKPECSKAVLTDLTAIGWIKEEQHGRSN